MHDANISSLIELDSLPETNDPENNIAENNSAENNHPETSLVVQHDPIFCETEERGEFEVFPLLPIEVRLKIWRMSFKRQHINLDVKSLDGHTCSSRCEVPSPSLRPIYPATLHTCQESRLETIRHYSILIPGKLRVIRATPTRLPVCVNLSIDSGSFSLYRLGNNPESYNIWLSKLKASATHGLKALEELEIRDCLWERELTNHFQHGMPCGRYSANLARQYRAVLAIILQFTGLKKVYYTYDYVLKNNWQLAAFSTALKECRETMEALLDQNSDVFVGGKAPEVKVRVWGDRYAGTMNSQVTETGWIYSTRNSEWVGGKAEGLVADRE